MSGTVTSGTVATGYRAGLADLVTRWREMVADSAGSVWTNAEAQTILDSYRIDMYRRELTPVPANVGGTTTWKTYLVGQQDIETVASGTAYWQVWDANGSAIGTANYTADYQTGILTFSADQRGSVRYLDGRSFDLYGAAAHGWRELAGAKSGLYQFSADGASYNRQQWFDHCMQMAEYYDRRTTTGTSAMSIGMMWRSDLEVS